MQPLRLRHRLLLLAGEWTMSLEVVTFIFGAILFAAALSGGNFSLGGSLEVPALSRDTRFVSGVIGLCFIGIAFWWASDSQSSLPIMPPEPAPEAAVAANVSPTLPSAPSTPSETDITALSLHSTTPESSTAALSGATPANTLLHTTLDSPDAITSPATGEAGLILNFSESDFVPGQDGNALAFVRDSLVVTYPAATGSTRHINLDRGEIRFWYRPDYDPDSGSEERVLFRVGVTADNPPALELVAGPALGFSATNEEWDSIGVMSPYAAPLWRAGEWVHIRAAWDTSDPTDSLRIYVNENRVDQRGAAGNWDLGSDPTRLTIYIGQANGFQPAGGVIDDFFILQ